MDSSDSISQQNYFYTDAEVSYGYDSGTRIIGVLLLVAQFISVWFILLAEFYEYDFWSLCYELDDSQSLGKHLMTAREIEYNYENEFSSDSVMIPTPAVIERKRAYTEKIERLREKTYRICCNGTIETELMKQSSEIKNEVVEKEKKADEGTKPKRENDTRKDSSIVKDLTKEKIQKTTKKKQNKKRVKNSNTRPFSPKKSKDNEEKTKVKAPPANFQEMAVQAMIDEMLASMGSDLSTQERSKATKKVERKVVPHPPGPSGHK